MVPGIKLSPNNNHETPPPPPHTMISGSQAVGQDPPGGCRVISLVGGAGWVVVVAARWVDHRVTKQTGCFHELSWENKNI